VDTDEEFERWLEHELRRTVGAVLGPSPRAAQSAYRAAAGRGVRWAKDTRLLASGTGKAAAGIVVAALAVGVGMKAATAGTGSTDPIFWGAGVIEEAGSVQGPSVFGSQPVEATATPPRAAPTLNPDRAPGPAAQRAHGKIACAGKKARHSLGTEDQSASPP